MNEPSTPRGGSRGAHFPDEGPSWPYASLLFFGFFGTDSPGGKRLAWRTTGGLALFVIGAVLLAGAHPAATVTGLLAMPGGVILIGWAYARYLSGLDELSRAIQLESFALAYAAAMTVMAALMAAELATPTGTRLGPGAAPAAAWIALAELFRGVALVLVARRYR